MTEGKFKTTEQVIDLLDRNIDTNDDVMSLWDILAIAKKELRDLVKEMESRELHHFEVEQENEMLKRAMEQDAVIRGER